MIDAVDSLCAALAGRRIAVLTGAGVSTESGIPDYRGEETRRRARSPVKFDVYLRDERARRAYWARSAIGWARIAGAEPNPAHRALAELERAGAAIGLITQNVDRLHHAAGSVAVIELHGALAEVRCLRCPARIQRADLQRRLDDLNPDWRSQRAEIAPDGDVDLPASVIDSFQVADCEHCGGPLKPDVVLFGESVPRERVDAALALVDRADALLIVGSSLAVYSGFRFARRAAERGLAIAVVNLGPTRADPLATCRVEGRAGAILPALSAALAPRP